MVFVLNALLSRTVDYGVPFSFTEVEVVEVAWGSASFGSSVTFASREFRSSPSLPLNSGCI